MTFKIYTLGCKVNFYDSNTVKAGLLANGLRAVDKNADLAIINTCSVTKIAQKKDRQVIVKAKKENPRAKIVVMGCFVKTYEAEAKKIDGVDLFWPVGKIDELVDRIMNHELRIKGIKNTMLHDSCFMIQKLESIERSRYFIKIQDGCEQFCSYCVIPYARGPLKSRSEKEVLVEIEKAVERGFKEIILSGIHLGLYGIDLMQKSKIKNQNDKSKCKINLVDLLIKILKIEKLGRIRLSSIEVTEVTDELIALMKKEKRICKHLHIPLQSGTDKILKRMNRPYDTNFFKKKIREIRKINKDIAITTDVIVGFPGETEKDFKETEKFIKKINFSALHVFSFSPHERTAASKMDGRVEIKDIKKRSEALRKLSKKLEKDYNDKFLNNPLEVILERNKNNKYIGKTEYFFDVLIKEKLINAKIGSLMKVFKWKLANIKD